MHNKKKTKVQCPKCNNEFEVDNGGGLKTGLYWEGKGADVEKISLPFQVIETINESRATREELKKMPLARDMGMGKVEETGWKNKLIWGDNKYVMSSLLDEFTGKIDLIYIDPPFATGADFSIKFNIGEYGLEPTSGLNADYIKQASIIEEKVYRDTWGKGLDSYMQMMYERVMLMRDLLSEKGSIYVHLDYRVVHYIKSILDEIFGIKNFRNQIIWKRATMSGGKAIGNQYGRNHDTVLFYSKSRDLVFNSLFLEYSQDYIDKKFIYSEKNGRRYRLQPKGTRSDESVEELRKQGRIVESKTGYIQIKFYLDEMKGVALDDVWLDIQDIRTIQAEQKLNYPTQKPEGLIERIIKVSSNKNDIVADFFCGAGTTLAVAEKMRDEEGKPTPRRWIGCDLSRFAIHTTRKRLLEIEGCRPFEVLNLGKYERQYWQGITFGDRKKKDTKKTISEYLQFIVKLYQAEPISGFRYLHGKKGRKMVCVGSVDAPVTLREIQEALEECKSAGQKELDVLGWEWEMGLHDVVEEESKTKGINLHLKTIPREVMDTRAVDFGDIQFFELAYLDTKVSKNKYDEFEIELKDFVIQNTDLIPEEVRKKIKKWSDYIDYWAVDWEYKDDTFHNQWQSYRTRRDRTLQLKSDGRKYEKKNKYTIMIKVIDIFGNDTTHIEEVTV